MMSYKRTCYGGTTLELSTRSTSFVSRAPADVLEANAFTILEKLSPFSFRVALRADESLDSQIARARQFGPSFYDYVAPDKDDSDPLGSELLVTDRLFLTFNDAFTEQRLADVMGERLILVDRCSERTVLLQVHRRDDPVDVLTKLKETYPDIEVEHDVNHRVKPQEFELPTDNGFQDQWHLKTASDGRRGSIGADAAWKKLRSFGKRDVVICITDAAFGIEDHPDFGSEGKIAGFAYFCGNHLVSSADSGAERAELMVGTPRQVQHGTSCAALAAADVGGHLQGLTVGVAPGCRLYLVRLPHDGDGTMVVADSHLCRLIRHIRNEVDVVSSSWGNIRPRSYWSSHTRRLLGEVAKSGGRRGKGIVFVWAAGNADCPIARDFRSAHAVPFEKTETGAGVEGRDILGMKTARHFVNQLVGIENVLHVAACTSEARRSRYSNYGAGIDLAAPSNNGDDPFGCTEVPGEALLTSTTNSEGPAITNFFGGTSAAAPIVAGVAALTISANPNLTASEVVAILGETAERNLNFAPYEPITCFEGVRDVSPVEPFDEAFFKDDKNHPGAPWSPWFGFGRIDASKSVEKALNAKMAVSSEVVIA